MVEPGDNLPECIKSSLLEENIALQNGDVIVLAQKIVSKSENRFVGLARATPSDEAKVLALKCGKDACLVQLILDESTEVLRCVPGVIIVRHKLGFVMANAGIDHSNIAADASGERVLLLPEYPDQSAAQIRQEMERETGLELAVDNHPLRALLVPLGYAWAASSYSRNDYDIISGVQDTHASAQITVTNIL